MTEKLNPEHPMTRMLEENAVKFLGLFIWKLRAHLPNLEIRITAKDMEEMTRGFAFQTPVIGIIGEQDAVVLRLMDAGGGELMVRSKDAMLLDPAVVEMEKMLQARKDAPGISTLLIEMANKMARDPEAGALSEELIRRAADALMLLSGPHEEKR